MDKLTTNERVELTITRLISNLPSAIEILRENKRTSLARQIKNDLDNLISFQDTGRLEWINEKPQGH